MKQDFKNIQHSLSDKIQSIKQARFSNAKYF